MIVKDSATLAILPQASIAVMNDSHFIKGIIADSAGLFDISLETGFSYIAISSIGYKIKKVSASQLLTHSYNVVYLLPDEKVLAAVNVMAQKVKVQQLIDKKVYDFSDAEQTAGLNVQQLLISLPEITIEQSDGSVYLRGNEKAEVYVNMKKSTLDLAELLANIPAANIEKIEVITTPSAKQQASGIGGIVNIVLKQNRNKGFGISTTLDAAQPASGINMNSHYGFEKVNLKFNVNYKKSDFTNTQWIDRKFSTGHSESIYTRYRTKGSLLSASTVLELFPQKKHEFSILADYTFDQHTAMNPSDYYNLSNSPDYSFLHKNKHTHHVGTINGNYRFKPTDHTFLEFDYYLNTSKNSYPISNFKNGSSINTQLLHEDFTIQSAAIDYAATVFKKIKIESGYLMTNQALSSDRLLGVTNQPDIYETFLYNEALHGFYIKGKGGNSQFTVQGGLRYEIFQSNTTDDTEKRTLENKNLFPSLHVSLSLSPVSKLNVGYSKRILRADFHQLNALQIVSPLFRWLFNPNIRPEHSHNVDLSFNTALPATSFSIGLFYREKRRLILWREYSQNDQQYFMYENAKQLHNFGSEFSFSQSFGNKISGRLSGNWTYYSFKNEVPVSWPKGATSTVQIRTSYKPVKNISTELSYYYYFKNRSFFAYTEPRQKLDLNFHWRIAEDKWAFNIRINDILNSNRIQRTSKVPGLDQNTIWDIAYQKRYAQVGITYKFSKVTLKQRQSLDRQHIEAPID